jgi:lipopolysaccharide biosynthesis protein
MDQIIKSIALYLPQYHPIPENDEWWGKGFTEWANVTKAQPLFQGHQQPRLPADLGFYDLRVPEARQAQADLAKQYGVHGFCYWHYWFGGKRIIERPFMEVVASGQPDFPFCVAWANQTWSGTWHGLSSKKLLIEQTYPGEEDYKVHFYSLLDAFKDPRYIEVNGKKLVLIFQPMDIPHPKAFTDCWRSLALKEGLKGLHLVGMHMPTNWDAGAYGFDAFVQYWLKEEEHRPLSFIDKVALRLLKKDLEKQRREKRKLPLFVSYPSYIQKYPGHHLKPNEYPLIYTDWDNTARSGTNGWMFRDFSPALFEEVCYKGFVATDNKQADEKIVILKSWNEWAEGNYLEPDLKYGHAYLQAFSNALKRYHARV